MTHTELPTFVNNFWGNDTGFITIQTKIKHSLSTLQELLDYYQERTLIEKDFNKKLTKLNGKISLGSHETGTLKISLDKLQLENGQAVKNSNKFAKSVTQVNQDKLNAFMHIYSKSTGKILHHINKILVKKSEAFKSMESHKERYKNDAHNYKSLKLLDKTTWGNEKEKYKQKFSKVAQSLQASKKNYQLSLITYRELSEIFVRDWTIALQDIYKLEIEKIQCVKVNCFSYCNHIATLCVDNDQSVDLARSVFAQIQPDKDLQDFSDNFGTGNKIAIEPEFIDYMGGFDDDNVTLGYSVAQVDLPDYAPVLSKLYSQRTAKSEVQPSHQVYQAQQPQTYQTPQYQTQKPQYQTHAYQAPQNLKIYPATPNMIPQVILAPPTSDTMPKTPSPTRKAPRGGSSYSSSEDIFEKEFKSSSGSNYSNPTNYSSNSDRHWASPRRKEKQLHQVQEKINLKSKELPSKPQLHAPAQEAAMPIMKDFSIDFIAKALEDLNSGGNGDVSRFRRSVRRAKAREEEDEQRSKTAPTSPFKSHSDYVNDRTEVATRYESISFTPREAKSHQRSKSMLDFDDSATTTILNPKRTLSLSKSSKSYNNLHSIAGSLAPVSRRPYISYAKARYSYKPQHHGELFFKKGWEMYILRKQEDQWYECELSTGSGDVEGQVGLVPGNYLVEAA